jgi:hypothetical protein
LQSTRRHVAGGIQGKKRKKTPSGESGCAIIFNAPNKKIKKNISFLLEVYVESSHQLMDRQHGRHTFRSLVRVLLLLLHERENNKKEK